MVLQSIDIGSGGQISLDTIANDDIVISTFSVMNGVVDRRFPDTAPMGFSYAGNQTSKFTDVMISSMLNPAAPNAGLVLIEIYFEYHMVLGLPWIQMFVPDPVMLHAYSIMPNSAVEPTPTPP